MTKIKMNGKFFKQKLTGVQRFALEISRHLPYEVEIPTYSNKIYFLLWEQIFFPVINKNYLKLYLCNSNSIFDKNKIVVFHDLAVIDNPNSFSFKFRFFYTLFMLPALKRSKHIVTVSNFSKKRLVEYLKIPAEKISVIYNAVDKDRFFPHGVKKDYILALSSIEPRKNITRLIKAYKRAKNINPNIPKLYICGEKKNNLFAAVNLDTDENISFLGYISDNNLPTLLSEAQLLVYPSLYEGFGLPPLEAMACGTPVIVSNICSLPEVVGDAGSYCDPFSTDSICESILSFFDGSIDYNKQVDACLIQASKFDWKNSARDFKKIVEENL